MILLSELKYDLQRLNSRIDTALRQRFGKEPIIMSHDGKAYSVKFDECGGCYVLRRVEGVNDVIIPIDTIDLKFKVLEEFVEQFPIGKAK